MKNLCKTCRNSSFVTFANGKEIIECSWISTKITAPVIECSYYDDKTYPSKNDLENMAWILETTRSEDKIVGFKWKKPTDKKN